MNHKIKATIGFFATLILTQQIHARFNPPKYQLFRFKEDWSVMKHKPTHTKRDFWDPIKYITSDPQNGWVSLGGSARYRYEDWTHLAFGNTNANDGNFAIWNVFLHADIHASQHSRIFIEGKFADASSRDLTGGRRALDVDHGALQQAFVDFNFPLAHGNNLLFRPGRQELAFGKQRLVSPLPWVNTYRTWDGATAILNYQTWKITGFATKFVPVIKYQFNVPDEDRQFGGIYATGKMPITRINMDLYWLQDKNWNAVYDGTAGHEKRHTYGTRLWGKISPLAIHYEGEFALQRGRVDNKSIRAYMIGLNANYQWQTLFAKPKFNIGYEYGSGGDRNSLNTVKTFKPPFPLGHAYYGYIDIVGRENAEDLNFTLSLQPHKRVTLAAAHHSFKRSSNDDALYNVAGGIVRAGNLATSKDIGDEVDVTLKYKYSQHIASLIGYSHLSPGSFIKNSGNAGDTTFKYLQIKYTF